MCEHSGKLVAWLDRELADDEMAEVERHLEHCGLCRGQASKYELVSKSFDAYCELTKVASGRRKRPRRVPVLSGAGVVALAASVVLFLVYRRIESPPSPVPMPVIVPQTLTADAVPVLGKAPSVPRRRAASRTQGRTQTVRWIPDEPAIEIAIPAESMFPPGAVPEGVSFAADVSFAPDGSAQQIRLRPRLIGFERGGPQP